MLVEQMTHELAQLRRGHGLHAEDVVQRTGNLLRSTCGIAPGEDAGVARRKLTERISAMVEALPPDLRMAVQAAFALSPATQSRFLKDRMAWLGQQLGRDPRTATRRVQSGLALLAERMVAGVADNPLQENDYAPEGWYVDKLTSTLLLTTDPVQLIEQRIVVATRDRLDQVAVSWSVPRVERLPEDVPIEVELIYGGELIRNEQLSAPTYWAGWIRLPRPLDAGEQHEYQVRVSTGEQRLLRPYYVLSPYRRCDEFALRVKFDPGRLPVRIWRLDGVPYRVVDQGVPGGSVMQPNSVGEVSLKFGNPRQGLSYGLQWSDSTA